MTIWIQSPYILVKAKYTGWPFWSWNFILNFTISLSIIFYAQQNINIVNYIYLQQNTIKINDSINARNIISFISFLLLMCPINEFYLSLWYNIILSFSCCYILVYIICISNVYMYVYIESVKHRQRERRERVIGNRVKYTLWDGTQMYWYMCTHHIYVQYIFFNVFKSSWKCLFLWFKVSNILISRSSHIKYIIVEYFVLMFSWLLPDLPFKNFHDNLKNILLIVSMQEWAEIQN